MAKQLFTNNATCLLAVALGGTAGDTTMYVEAGKGALFPNPTGGDWFLTTLVDAAGLWEIVKVTARATDTFTIVRGQEGSTIRAFATPGTTKVGLRPTKGTMEGLAQKPELGMDTLAIVTISGNVTLAATDFKPLSQLSKITATATVTLPAANTVSAGYSRVFKSFSTGDVQFAPNGADTIDGAAANFRLPSYCEVEFVSDGAAGWLLMRRPNVWVGKIEMHGNAANEPGYLACDGASYSTATYAGLFAKIGYTFGGSGANFNVPNTIDRAMIGAGAAPAVVETQTAVTSSGAALYQVPVSSNNTKWITGMPVVLSSVSGFTGLANGSYWVIRRDATHVSFASSLANAQNGVAVAVTGTGNFTMTYTLTARTLGEVGGEDDHAMNINELLAHTHTADVGTLNQDDIAGGAQGRYGSGGSTGSTGGNTAMNIKNPFLACNYAIKT